MIETLAPATKVCEVSNAIMTKEIKAKGAAPPDPSNSNGPALSEENRSHKSHVHRRDKDLTCNTVARNQGRQLTSGDL